MEYKTFKLFSLRKSAPLRHTLAILSTFSPEIEIAGPATHRNNFPLRKPFYLITEQRLALKVFPSDRLNFFGPPNLRPNPMYDHSF